MRRIDHVVVAVQDLDRAADLYRRLGFQVGARNRHPWGTENRLIQFGASFIELITVGDDAWRFPPHEPRRFSFGAFVRDSLEAREGVAMLVLSSADASSDALGFAQSGLGDFEPFHFERTGRRPDGSATQVAFTLAFAVDPRAPEAGFFVCEQHFPENFWNRRFQEHANGATDIAAVTLRAADPRAHASFLSRFCGTDPRTEPDDTSIFPLDGGRIVLASAPHTRARLRESTRVTSVAIEVSDTDAVARLLEAERLSFTASHRRVVISPASLFGVELQFEMA